MTDSRTAAARATTLAMHEQEQAVVAGREAYTVFNHGGWRFVSRCGRPSLPYAKPAAAIDVATSSRHTNFDDARPITLEI